MTNKNETGGPPQRLSKLMDAQEEIENNLWGRRPMMFNHSVLCSVSLPIRNPHSDVYEKESGAVSLLLEAGRVRTTDGWRKFGLPYGPRARLILISLVSESIKNDSRTLSTRNSFTRFAKDLGLSVGGYQLRSLREQMTRMASVQMKIAREYEEHIDVFQGHLFDGMRLEMPSDAYQMTMFPSVVSFSEQFFQSCKRAAVPLDARAIRALSSSARDLDIYMWLAHRLHRIKGKPVNVKWTSLRFQFASSKAHMGNFKRDWTNSLKRVLMVYPQAKVEITDYGCRLYASPPPIPKKGSKLII